MYTIQMSKTVQFQAIKFSQEIVKVPTIAINH